MPRGTKRRDVGTAVAAVGEWNQSARLTRLFEAIGVLACTRPRAVRVVELTVERLQRAPARLRVLKVAQLPAAGRRRRAR